MNLHNIRGYFMTFKGPLRRVSFLVLGFTFAIGITVGTFDYKSAKSSVRSNVVLSSGQKVATLFDGLPQDPKFSLRTMLAGRAALPRCGKKQGKEEASIFHRLFNSTVHAGGSVCLNTFCGGGGWVEIENSCNTGGPCSGFYTTVTTDPNSDAGFGVSSLHCGTIPACGCVEYTC